MSEDFGSYLKHERELRGIPLDEVATTTKIGYRFLQALEENRYEELPGEVFIKGFIRSYGKAIGSNVDELLAAYHESTAKRLKTPVSKTDSPPPIDYVASEEVSSSKPSFPRKAVVGFGLALAILGIGAIWMTTRDDDKSPAELRQTREIVPNEVDNSLPEVQSEPEFPISEEASGSPMGAGTADTTPSTHLETEGALAKSTVKETSQKTSRDEAGGAGPDKNTVTVPEKDDIIEDLQDQAVHESGEVSIEDSSADLALKLVIRVDENSWFNLTIDDHRDQDFILPSGGSKTIVAEKAIVMTIGNRRATQLTLNDQLLEIPESPDNVIRNLIVNAELLE